MTIFFDFDRKMMPVLPINFSIFDQMGMAIDRVPPPPPFLQNVGLYTKTVHYFAGDLTSYIVWRFKNNF